MGSLCEIPSASGSVEENEASCPVALWSMSLASGKMELSWLSVLLEVCMFEQVIFRVIFCRLEKGLLGGFDLREIGDGVSNGSRLSVQKRNCEAFKEKITMIDR